MRMPTAPRPRLLLALAAALALPAAEDPLQATAAQRTALHQDPTLDAPFASLVEAWKGGGRLGDLIAIYRGHLAKWPDDRAAAAVLVRLLIAAGDPGAPAAALAAAEARADDPYLRFLAYRALHEAKDPRALDQLDRAVGLETAPWRRKAWANRLVVEALAAGRAELAAGHLAAAAAAETGAAGKLAVATRQIQAGLHAAAAETLAAAEGLDAAPETRLEIDLARAECDEAAGRQEAAAERLDAILGRLAGDHWRRAEVLRRRLRLAGPGGAEAMLAAAAAAAKARPADEAAQLDHAGLLLARDRRREAAEALAAAADRLPGSARLEQEALAAFARLHDPEAAAAWLARRIAAAPQRAELRLLRAEALFELRRADQARGDLDAGLAGLPAERRRDAALDLARKLRRMTLHAEAAAVLRPLVEGQPERLDLARELGESLASAGSPADAAALFAGLAPAAVRAAAPEHVLEGVRFLAGLRQPTAARRLAEARLAADPGHFELRLEVARLAAAVGEPRRAVELAVEARPLADTAPRYRLWLAAAAEAAGDDLRPRFLAEERDRLGREGEVRDRAARRAAFAEAAGPAGAAEAEPLLADELERTAAPAERAALRRQLIALLAADGKRAAELAEQLDRLAEEDPSAAMECQARRLLIGMPADLDRADLGEDMRSRLAAIDPAGIGDAALLGRLDALYLRMQDLSRCLAAAARLCQLEPASRDRWARYLTLLAIAGDEVGLRRECRRLLAGVDALVLADEHRALIRSHLADSLWRSIAGAAAAGRWDDALGLIDEADAIAGDGDVRRWAAFARALALGRLGRDGDRERAIGEVQRLLAASAAGGSATAAAAAGGDAESPPADRIAFPDGLIAGPASLRIAPAPPPAAGDRAGPLPPLRLRWAYDADRVPTGAWIRDGQVVVADAGGVAAIDAATGKLRWRRSIAPYARPTGAATMRPGGGRTVVLPPIPDGAAAAPPPAQPAIGGWGIAIADDGAPTCLDAAGEVRWRTTAVRAERLIAAAGLLIAWSPADGAAAGLDPADGRLRWTARLPPLGGGQVPPHAQADGARALLGGAHGGIIDAASGTLLWGFSADAAASARVVFDRPAPALPAGRHGFFHGGGSGTILLPSVADGGPAQRIQALWSLAPRGAMMPIRMATAAIAGGDAARYALVGGRLWVGAGGAIRPLPADLPLLPGPAARGTPIAAVGRWIAAVAADGVFRLNAAAPADLVDGEAGERIGQADPAADGRAAPVLGAALDGAVLWWSTRIGVAACNITSGAEIARLPWPAPSAVADDASGFLPGGAAVGAVDGALVVLPAGGNRLAALERAP